MFDGPLMLQVNWSVVDTIHPQSNMFVTNMKIKATAESKLHDSLLYKNNCSDFIDTFCFYRLFTHKLFSETVEIVSFLFLFLTH